MTKKDQAETPLMKQHREIKAKYPDAVLLFRVGDFYETFAEDAAIAAKVLGITLTKRANGAASSVALAGFPHHALDAYLHKLVRSGYRVAICDQLEDPKLAKGVVKRGVTELVTPGVATSDKLLEHHSNNFLAAIWLNEHQSGIAFVDISTGDFFAAQGSSEYLEKLIQGFQPSEIVVSKAQYKAFQQTFDTQLYSFQLEDWIFAINYTYELLTQHFGTKSLKGYGVEELPGAIVAAGAAIHYLRDTEHTNLQHIQSLQRLTAEEFLWMDRFTIRNLELIHTNQDHGVSLLRAIDRTITPMGARLLRRWLLLPLYDIHRIQERQAIVSLLLNHQQLVESLKKIIAQIGDVERLASKIPLRKANPREVLQLANALLLMGLVREACESYGEHELGKLTQAIQPLHDLYQRITSVLTDDPPIVLAKGGVIKEGISQELDDLRRIVTHGKEILLTIQQKEAQHTGISSLKIAYNNVFGYYLEVTHAHKEKVPETWIRKQTLTNAERYITPELKEYEEKILGAEEKILSLEANLYAQTVQQIAPFLSTIQANAQVIAQLDCLLSFAIQAHLWKYNRPTLAEDATLDIKSGRHPVIEQALPPGETYVANDTFLDRAQQQIIILTGPNMSGKSALLRQTAIITILAHMGSYVPAAEASIGLTDKIFTRVGASDNLSGGESTFMVEMTETASIVNNISDRSLLLLDEIGRGTSTYDGISIAWSIVEYLHQHPSQPKTIFATHYHELNELEETMPRVRNFHITHRETSNKVIFLRKLEPGGSRHSFGIQVARMAGMPPTLLRRAEHILSALEEKHKAGEEPAKALKQVSQAAHIQLNIFDGVAEDLREIQRVLTETEINTLTPVEALLKLNELKNIIKSYNKR